MCRPSKFRNLQPHSSRGNLISHRDAVDASSPRQRIGGGRKASTKHRTAVLAFVRSSFHGERQNGKCYPQKCVFSAYPQKEPAEPDFWQKNAGDGMQTAALADCERLRTNMRHA